jgi:hypothetical protein
MKCEECQLSLEEFFDGELGDQSSELVEAHVARCADCQAHLEALRTESELYATFGSDLEISPALWSRVHAEIEGDKESYSGGAFQSLTALLGRVSFWSSTPVMAAVAVMVILTVLTGVLLIRYRSSGRQVFVARNEQPDTPLPPGRARVTGLIPQAGGDSTENPGEIEDQGGAVAPTTQKARTSKRTRPSSSYKASVTETGKSNRSFIPDMNDETEALVEPASLSADDQEVSHHIERVQLLLRSFRNSRLVGNRSEIAFEKRLSRELLSQNMFLRRSAESSGKISTAELLSDLEPYLLDIANLTERPSRDDVRTIRNRIQKNEIVAELQVR